MLFLFFFEKITIKCWIALFFLFIDYLEMCMLLNMYAYLDKVGILLKFWCKNLGFLNIPMIPSIILVYHVIGYIRHLKCHLFKILSTLSKTSLLNFSQLLALHFSKVQHPKFFNLLWFYHMNMCVCLRISDYICTLVLAHMMPILSFFIQ